MATNQQTFETIVRLNAQEAKNELAALQQNLEALRKKKADALKDSGTSAKDITRINKEIKTAEAALKSYSSGVAKTIDTISNLSTASLGDIEKAAREVRKAMKQVSTPRITMRSTKYCNTAKTAWTSLKTPPYSHSKRCSRSTTLRQTFKRFSATSMAHRSTS